MLSVPPASTHLSKQPVAPSPNLQVPLGTELRGPAKPSPAKTSWGKAAELDYEQEQD